MKYLFQIGIIAAISAVAEFMYAVIPLPVPASVYGLALLFILLMTKVIKLSQIEETADYFLLIMPVLFLEPSVKLMTSLSIMKGQAVRLFVLCMISTCVTIMITGTVAQAVIRMRKKGKKGQEGKADE